MSKKAKKKLPMVIIEDENDGSIKRLISRSYVESALQGLLLVAYEEPDQIISKIDELIQEIRIIDIA